MMKDAASQARGSEAETTEDDTTKLVQDLIRRSFAGCGITKATEECLYHPALMNILQDKGVGDVKEDHTGLTDNEDSDDSNDDY